MLHLAAIARLSLGAMRNEPPQTTTMTMIIPMPNGQTVTPAVHLLSCPCVVNSNAHAYLFYSRTLMYHTRSQQPSLQAHRVPTFSIRINSRFIRCATAIQILAATVPAIRSTLVEMLLLVYHGRTAAVSLRDCAKNKLKAKASVQAPCCTHE